MFTNYASCSFVHIKILFHFKICLNAQLTLRRTVKQQLDVRNSSAVLPEVRKPASLLHRAVFDFYCRDDNSRITAGKKETVTFKKQKAQRRYLCFTVESLYENFLSENPKQRISRTQFYCLRPFFVLRPSLKNRQVCLCSQCSNVDVRISRNCFSNLRHTSFFKALPYLIFTCSCLLGLFTDRKS